MFFRAFFSLKTFPCTVTKVDEPVVPHHNQRSPNTPRQDQVQNTECTAFIIYQAFEPRNGGHALEPHLNRSNGSTNGPNSNQPNPWQAGVGLAPPACAHLALSTLARSPFAPPHFTLRYPQQPDRPWHSKCAQYRSTCQKFGLQTNECSHTRGKYSYFKGRGPQPIWKLFWNIFNLLLQNKSRGCVGVFQEFFAKSKSESNQHLEIIIIIITQIYKIHHLAHLATRRRRGATLLQKSEISWPEVPNISCETFFAALIDQIFANINKTFKLYDIWNNNLRQMLYNIINVLIYHLQEQSYVLSWLLLFVLFVWFEI